MTGIVDASDHLKYMNDYLAGKGITLKCIICNQSDFILELPLGVDNYDYNIDKKIPQYTPILMFTCKKCGYVLPFSAEQTKFYDFINK